MVILYFLRHELKFNHIHGRKKSILPPLYAKMCSTNYALLSPCQYEWTLPNIIHHQHHAWQKFQIVMSGVHTILGVHVFTRAERERELTF